MGHRKEQRGSEAGGTGPSKPPVPEHQIPSSATVPPKARSREMALAAAGESRLLPSGETALESWLRRFGLLLAIVITLLIRAIHLWHLSIHDPFFRHTAPGTDMETYWNQGSSIAGGDWLLRSFSGAFYYGPLYSYFLAPLISIFGKSLPAVHGVQFVLGLLVPVLAWFMAGRLAGPVAAASASLLAGLCVPILFWNQTVLGEGLILLLVSAAVLLITLATVREHANGRVCRTIIAQWLVAGALLGLAVSGRGNTLLVILGLAAIRILIPTASARPAATAHSTGQHQSPATSRLALLWRARRNGAVLSAAFLAGAAATIALPIARNLAVAGKFAITTNGPALLYIGNYRDAIGVLTTSPHLEELMQKHGGEVPYMAELRKDIAEDPMRLLRHQWTKTRIFLSAYDAPDNFSLDLYSRFSPVLRWNPVGWALVITLGGIGFWNLRRRLGPRGDLWPLSAVLILFPLSLIPILVVGRYRLPWLFPVIVLAGAGCAVLYRAWLARDRRSLLPWALWAGFVFTTTLPRFSPASQVISIPQLPPRYVRPNDWTAWMAGMKAAGSTQAQIDQVKNAALRENPDVPLLVYPEAERLATEDKLDASIQILQNYLRYQTADTNAARALAVMYIRTRQPDRASELLLQILRINPNDEEARQLLASLGPM